jgi:hypothetical protein
LGLRPFPWGLAGDEQVKIRAAIANSWVAAEDFYPEILTLTASGAWREIRLPAVGQI